MEDEKRRSAPFERSGNQSEELPERKQTSFGADVLRLVTGTSAAQIIGILASPVLTRLYPPEAFGVLAMFTSLIGIFGVATCMRYELSIVLPESDREAANLLALSLVFTILFTALTFPIVVFGGPFLVQWMQAPGLGPYLWLIPASVLIYGVYSALNYWNTRTKHFTQLSVANVTTTVTTQAISLGAGFAEHGTSGSLITANVVGQSVGTALLGTQVWRQSGRFLRQSISLKGMVTGLKRYRKFPLFELPGAVVNVVALLSPPLLLAVFFPGTVVGFFALAIRMLQLPMTFIGSALSQVYFGNASAARQDDAKLSRITEDVFVALATMVMLPACVLAVLGDEAFALVFGAEWTEAGIYAQIMAPWLFFWAVSSPLASMFVVKERQGSASMIHVAVFIARLVPLIIGGVYGSMYVAIALFSVAGSLVYLLIGIWSLRLAGAPWLSSVYRLKRQLLLSVGATGVLVILQYLSIGNVGLISVALLAFAAYYLYFFKQRILIAIGAS